MKYNSSNSNNNNHQNKKNLKMWQQQQELLLHHLLQRVPVRLLRPSCHAQIEKPSLRNHPRGRTNRTTTIATTIIRGGNILLQQKRGRLHVLVWKRRKEHRRQSIALFVLCKRPHHPQQGLGNPRHVFIDLQVTYGIFIHSAEQSR